MTLKRLTFLFSILIVAFSTSSQQSSPTATKDPQAVSVLGQSLVAAGGISAVETVQDVTGTGNITYAQTLNAQGSVIVRAKGLDELRIDADITTGLRAQVMNNGQMTIEGQNGRVVQTRSEAPPYPSRIVLPTLFLLPALYGPEFSLLYEGLIEVEGHAVHDIRVQVVMPGLPDPGFHFREYHTLDLFIDPSTFHIVLMQDVVPNHLTRRIQFSDYRNVNGIVAPFLIAEQRDGFPTWTIQLSQVNLNTGLQDSDFKL